MFEITWRRVNKITWDACWVFWAFWASECSLSHATAPGLRGEARWASGTISCFGALAPPPPSSVDQTRALPPDTAQKRAPPPLKVPISFRGPILYRWMRKVTAPREWRPRALLTYTSVLTHGLSATWICTIDLFFYSFAFVIFRLCSKLQTFYVYKINQYHLYVTK